MSHALHMAQMVYAKTMMGPPDHCWEYGGALSKDGYGVIHNQKKRQPYRAHRAVYEAAHGVVLTADQLVCHKCDNRRCVNPEHLFLGSHEDNMLDRGRKGRNGKNLTASQVVAIRSAKGQITGVEAARQYGVHHSAIYNIWNNKFWRHLDAGGVSFV